MERYSVERVRAMERTVVVYDARVKRLASVLGDIVERDGVTGGVSDTSGLRAELASCRRLVARIRFELEALRVVR